MADPGRVLYFELAAPLAFLLHYKDSEDDGLREAVAIGLGRYYNESGVATLLESMTEDPSPAVRRAANTTLVENSHVD